MLEVLGLVVRMEDEDWSPWWFETKQQQPGFAGTTNNSVFVAVLELVPLFSTLFFALSADP